MTEEELMDLQRSEDAAMDAVESDNAGFVKTQERNRMLAQIDAEQARAEAAFLSAADTGRSGLLAAAPKASVPVDQVRHVSKPTSKSFAKQENNNFKAQVNQQTRVGDAGGSGARMRAKPATAAEGPSRVKISKGDTLWALSQKYGMSVDELRALNGGIDPRKLRIGAELKLRADAPASMDVQAQASGPSALAQKLAAMRGEKRSGVPYGELARGFHNNPDNTATLDTAGNYLNAAAGVGGAVVAPRLAGLLASAGRKVAPRAGRAARNTEQMADRLFPEGSVLRRTRRMYDE